MGVYSIKDLENLTQIKAHTLRIWEQRYNLLQPKRTDTNIRFYSDKDLKKILNVNLLYLNGMKISKIAKLTEDDILELANEILLIPSGKNATNVERFVNRIIRFDEIGINEELEKSTDANGLEYAFENLLIPVLEKVGALWQVDAITAAHEHFFSNIVRAFIVRQTALLEEVRNPKATVLLFLKENEYHEIGLLFYNYVLRSRGYHTIYLGQSVPNDDIEEIIRQFKPNHIFSSLVTQLNKKEFTQFFKDISSVFPVEQLHVGGYQLKMHNQIIPNGVNIIHSVGEIKLQ